MRRKTIRISSRPPENLIKCCDISYVRFLKKKDNFQPHGKMKKLPPLRIIFVVVLSQNEVILDFLPALI